MGNLPRSLLQLLRRVVGMTSEPKITVGLDIGSSSIKAVALGINRAGARPIIGYGLVPLNQGEEFYSADTIKTALVDMPAQTNPVVIGVAGQSVFLRIVDMPEVSPHELKRALPLEAERFLPFAVGDVEMDGQILSRNDKQKVSVLIAACKKDLIQRRIDLLESAGLMLSAIDADALAVANAYLAQNERASYKACALLHVGAGLTNLVIFRDEVPALVRDIPWGAEHFVEELSHHLGMEKNVAGQEFMRDSFSEQAGEALRLACEALVVEVQLSFDYFENQHGKPPEGLLLSGGCSLSKAFLNALASHFVQPVNGWSPEGLSSQFAVAYGLALRKVN